MSKVISRFDNTGLLETLTGIAMNSQMKYRHASALMNRNGVACLSHNKIVNNISFHAECSVISIGKSILKSVKGLDILVIRINKNGVINNSRPCNNCIDELIKNGIRNIYYSDTTGRIVKEYVKDMERLHICGKIKNSN